MIGTETKLKQALQDRYDLERELGRGGMAIVFLARDRRHNRLVALKTLRPELVPALGPDRFLREIRIAAQLQHHNILPLHDSGEADGLLYYVMPYVDGESLRARLDREGQLPIENAIDIARQVAQALAYAHGQGVIHRDIKPENILLSGDHALVMDFGIARAITEAAGERLTETGLALGTAAYMSPEQAAGDHRVDGRSDIYSLGCVLYEMIAGSPPFTGPSAQAIVARKLTDPLPPLRTVRESMPELLEQAVRKALSRTPADRFPTASQLVDALARIDTNAVLSPDSNGRGHRRNAFSRAFGRRGALAVLGLSALLLPLGGSLWVRESNNRWARAVAVPEAIKLDGQGRIHQAYRLLRKAETHLPDDPTIRDLLTEWTTPADIRSTPPGAQVYVRDFFDPADAWELLGSTPQDTVRLPLGNLVWKISHPGFQTQEALRAPWDRTLSFSLASEKDTQPGMVQIGPTPSFELFSIPAAELGEYWIDKYEVTNRQFKEFLDRGGYDKAELWERVLARNSGSPTLESARQIFRDRTGRPGPATWEVGTFEEGKGDHPVAGISWYEAAAYCASLGNELPTLYHWYRAADPGAAPEFARYGNFRAAGSASVGQSLRLGANGTYDMAGNAKEWSLTQAGPDRRYILGGGWNEPSYQFVSADAQRPLDRQPTYGVRCARYRTPLPPSLLAPVPAPSRDYGRERPAGNESFAIYQSQYRYDPTPLEARVDSTLEQFGPARVEWISFRAAYGTGRVTALLYLPRNTPPPYQTVVYFPGGNVFVQRQPPATAMEVEGDWFLFLVRSGRAVLFPLYDGTYERHIDGMFQLPHVWRDVMIHDSKDLRRAVDYLKTRPDLDPDRHAYLGLSMGAAVGPIMTALEPRFKANVLIGGGLYFWRRPPESESFNFLPRVKAPTLMINGRHDFAFPLQTSQLPMFRLLGAPPAQKRHRVFESGHVPTERQEVFKEILDWYDRYLGPVRK